MDRRASRWSRNPADTNGYICMPLEKNIPNGRPDWERTKCPECGAACWRRPSQKKLMERGYKALCTECALAKLEDRVI